MEFKRGEDFFRHLFETVPRPLLVCDRGGEILETNPAAASLFGYSRGQLLGTNLLGLVHDEDRSRLKAGMESVTPGEPATPTVKFLTRRGQTLELETRLQHTEFQALPLVLAFLQDPADGKCVQHEGCQSSWMLETILDTIPQKVFWKDRNLTYLGCNRALAFDAGLDHPADIVGKTDFDLSWRASAHLYRRDDAMVMQGGTAKLNFEEPQNRGDGTLFWLRTSKVPLRDPEGRIIGIVGCYEDITDQKRVEESLRKSEESFRLLFGAIPHPIFVHELHSFGFLEVNPAASVTFGYSRSELLTRTVPELLVPEERQRFHDDMRSGEIFKSPHRKWKVLTKDGRSLTAEIERHRFDLVGREVALVFLQDVTHREQMEVELRQHQKLQAVGGLAAGVAHEINTPIQFVGDDVRFLQTAFDSLHAVLRKSEQLRKAAKAGSIPPELVAELDEASEAADIEYLMTEVPRAISESLEGVERVATIVRAMKQFAHPDQGEMVNADLNEALKSTLVIARNEWKYIADVEEAFTPLPPVQCSLGDLNQVFLNLLVNAAHAIHAVVKDSGQKGKIRVETSVQADWVQVAVTDSGCGIPEDIQSKVFDPFFTTKGVGQGTGQGLAIARSIVVEKHHGSLTFSTQVGQGTTFFVKLPCSQSQAGMSSPANASTLRRGISSG